jgi:hypothetical protein
MKMLCRIERLLEADLSSVLLQPSQIRTISCIGSLQISGLLNTKNLIQITSGDILVSKPATWSRFFVYWEVVAIDIAVAGRRNSRMWPWDSYQ